MSYATALPNARCWPIETDDRQLSKTLFKPAAHLTLLATTPRPDTFLGRGLYTRVAQ